MMRRRKSDWDRTAPTVSNYGDFRVGQEVIVSRNTKSFHVSYSGTIISLVMPKTGWKFAVVEDGCGGTHACDFEELR
jgi:hypothetical protein